MQLKPYLDYYVEVFGCDLNTGNRVIKSFAEAS